MTPSDPQSLAANLPRIRQLLALVEQAKQEWESAADALPELMLILHAQGHILRANRTLERWRLGDVLSIRGRNVHDLFHPDCPLLGCPLDNQWHEAWQHVTDGRAAAYELNDRVLGRYLHFQLQPIPPQLTRQSKMKMAGFAAAIIHDITEKKQLETQFLRAQRLESIGALAGGIAHDLNNILAPILIATGIWSRSQNRDEQERLIQTIASNTRRASTLVQQILLFARGLEGERRTMTPGPLLKEVQQLIVDTFPKSITVQVDFPADLWSLSADVTQLHQVILNLCVNGRDAMPQGGLLTLSAVNVDWPAGPEPDDQRPAGRYVALSVTDSGQGIPAVNLTRLFDPFFTTKAVGEGTGLGLFTVAAIVKNHGGFIEVNSEPDRGTTFRVLLPATDAGATAPERPAERLVMGHNQLILIVDDEATLREIVKEALESYGYRTLTAANGAEAISLFEQNRAEVALVLIDMAMPVMDGPNSIKILRTLNPNIKIIAVSGAAAPPSPGADDPEYSGIDIFLSKPFTLDTLLPSLAQLLPADLS